MPKLTDERRKQIQEHTERWKAFWDEIEQKYHVKGKFHMRCGLCGDMVVGVGPRGVEKALDEHEQLHPEYEEWIALSRKFDFSDLRDMLHDHNCVFVKCACICGCKSSSCVGDLPPEKQNNPKLCDICELYQGRGHIEHRLPEE